MLNKCKKIWKMLNKDKKMMEKAKQWYKKYGTVTQSGGKLTSTRLIYY